jgi:hypothetical protein
MPSQTGQVRLTNRSAFIEVQKWSHGAPNLDAVETSTMALRGAKRTSILGQRWMDQEIRLLRQVIPAILDNAKRMLAQHPNTIFVEIAHPDAKGLLATLSDIAIRVTKIDYHDPGVYPTLNSTQEQRAYRDTLLDNLTGELFNDVSSMERAMKNTSLTQRRLEIGGGQGSPHKSENEFRRG